MGKFTSLKIGICIDHKITIAFLLSLPNTKLKKYEENKIPYLVNEKR